MSMRCGWKCSHEVQRISGKQSVTGFRVLPEANRMNVSCDGRGSSQRAGERLREGLDIVRQSVQCVLPFYYQSRPCLPDAMPHPFGPRKSIYGSVMAITVYSISNFTPGSGSHQHTHPVQRSPCRSCRRRSVTQDKAGEKDQPVKGNL